MMVIWIILYFGIVRYYKGFDIYNQFDKLLSKIPNISMTYIGNYHNDYKPKNIKLMSPKTGIDLGNLLRSHDIYLTATQNEPGAMHYLEGLSCGLPILYCKGGGGVQEICSKFGEEFKNIKTMLKALEKIKNNYNNYVEKIDYKYLSSKRCNEEYNH